MTIAKRSTMTCSTSPCTGAAVPGNGDKLFDTLIKASEIMLENFAISSIGLRELAQSPASAPDIKLQACRALAQPDQVDEIRRNLSQLSQVNLPSTSRDWSNQLSDVTGQLDPSQRAETKEKILQFAVKHASTTSKTLRLQLKPGINPGVTLAQLFWTVVSGCGVQPALFTIRPESTTISMVKPWMVARANSRLLSSTYNKVKVTDLVDVSIISSAANRIRITGVQPSLFKKFCTGTKLNDSVLHDHLMRYNSHWFQEGDITDIVAYNPKSARTLTVKNEWTIKLTVSSDCYVRFLSVEDRYTRVIMDESRDFKVYEEVEPDWCSKCLRFDHSSLCMEQEQQCLACLSKHYLSDCQSNAVNPTCVNCHRANEELAQFGYVSYLKKWSPTDNLAHKANSLLCPIYKYFRDLKREELKRQARELFSGTDFAVSVPTDDSSPLDFSGPNFPWPQNCEDDEFATDDAAGRDEPIDEEESGLADSLLD